MEYFSQWIINKTRETVYPFVYGDGSWEASLVVMPKIKNGMERGSIWLGGLSSAYDRQALKKHDITRIVCAVYDINPIFKDDPDIIYYKVPVIDSPRENIFEYFTKASEFIEQSISSGKNVLIHCVYGVSRSSTLLCAYFIKYDNLSVTDAVIKIKRARPQVKPNIGFLRQLQTFYEKGPSLESFIISPFSSKSFFEEYRSQNLESMEI